MCNHILLEDKDAPMFEDEDRCYAIFSLGMRHEKHSKIKPKLYHSYSETYENMNCPEYTDVYELEKGGKCEEYMIFNYDKLTFCFDEPLTTRQYRSIIMSYPEKQMLSFSLPKSLTPDVFFERNIEHSQEIYASEKIEGALIHLFYDYRINRWEIATKRAVGGVYHFFNYKKKDGWFKKSKVRDLFMDALRIPRKTKFSELRLFDELSKDYCYSFVLQHPENRIVLPIVRPTLYLIAVFLTLPISNIAVSISPRLYETWEQIRNIPVIQFPESYHETYSLTIYKKWYLNREPDYNTAGIVVRNLRTGDHCSVKNPMYEKMLKWRGNSNAHALQYQYLALRRIGKLADYLAFFPKHKSEFSQFFDEYKKLVCDVHGFYMEKYVRKEKTQISDKYLYFVDDLHKNVFLPLLNKWRLDRSRAKPKMIRSMIFDYFNKMEPEQLLYIFNYDQRKY